MRSYRSAPRLLALVALALLPAALLGGCSRAAASNYVVQMTGNQRFSPAALTVPLGTTVVWQNMSTAPHTTSTIAAGAAAPQFAVLPPGAAAWDSGDVYPGDTWSRTFDTPGTYVYYCAHDGGQGMIGTIVVQP